MAHGDPKVVANNLPGPAPVVGNILIDLNTVLLNQVVLAGASFGVSLPNDPALAGLPLSTQGATFGPTTVELTNALDIVIGY